MLRKILLIAILVSLSVAFGCKKKESSPAIPTASEIEEQTEAAKDEGMKEIEAMEKEAEEQGQEAEQQIPK